jgi:hypothetical protein
MSKSSSSSFDGAPNNDAKVCWNYSPAPPLLPTTNNFCTSDLNFHLDDLSGGDGLLDLVIDDFCPPQQLMNGDGNTSSSSSSSSQSNNNNEQFMLHLPSSYSSTTMTRSYDAMAQDHGVTTTTVTGAIRASLSKAANFKSFFKGTKSNTNSNDDSDKLSDISSTSSCDDDDDEDNDRDSAYSESTNDDNDNDNNEENDNNDDIIAQPPRTLGLIFFDFIRCIAVSANIRCINTQLMPLFVMMTTSSRSSTININKQHHNNMDDIDILSISLRICITLFAIVLILVEFPNLFPFLHHKNDTDVTAIQHGERREKRRRQQQQQQRCNNNINNSNNSTHYLGGNRGSSSRSSSSSINGSSSTTSLLQRATDAEISINKQQRYDAEMNRLLPATSTGGGDTKVIDVIVHDGKEIIGRHRRNVVVSSSPPPQKKVVNESSFLLSSSYSTTHSPSTTSFNMKTKKKLTGVKIPPLYILNWIPRGILYIFLGLITLQQSIIVLAQDQSRHASISSRLFDGLFVLISGYLMLGVGCMYVLFGSCCLQPIMERVRYDDNVRWTKYYMLLDEMEDELQYVDEEQREICCFNYKRWYRGCDRCKKQWNRTGLCFEFRCRPIKCKW